MVVSEQIDLEFTELYAKIENFKLREILSTLHSNLVQLFKLMNQRLPTGENTNYFWAEASRDLLANIETTLELYDDLKGTRYAFWIDEYYLDVMNSCRAFLRPSYGSTIPPNMGKIELYYKIPIFGSATTVEVNHYQTEVLYPLTLIGRGSYADVFRYRDTFYERHFAVKRARKDLVPKELERFRREYNEMRRLSSPYILEVYCYNEKKNEYIMEYMDYSLDRYIAERNSTLSISERRGIANQILRAFEYVHSENRLHRDISPMNILVRNYDDIPVVKISDFGLVKIPDSTLTSFNTEFKGIFNDPSLVLEGFDTYDTPHEIYALTRVVYYVMAGRTNTDNISDPKLDSFVKKGMDPDKNKRYQTVAEMQGAFRDMW